MNFFAQFLYILLFTGLGELLAAVIPLPIPAAIYGLVLMLIALCTGILKAENIDRPAHFLIAILPLLFVAPGVSILRHWNVVRSEIAAICVITVVSTVITFGVSGLVTKLLLKKEDKKNV